MIMLKFFDWFADEFAVEGAQLFEDEEAIDEYFSEIRKLFEDEDKSGFVFYFGTNEALEWPDFAHFVACFEKVKIPKTAEPFVRKTFATFGIFPTLQ